MRLIGIFLGVMGLVSGIGLLGAVQAQDREVIDVWPKAVPGETSEPREERALPQREGQRQVIRLTDVDVPSMVVYQPPHDLANGCAVVICPGGGYSILAWDLEGTEIAEWLNSLGVTAFVLKYRVPRRKGDDANLAPLQDAQRAVRLVRHRAAKYGVDPNRIGVLGFSAGGHLTVMTGVRYGEDHYKHVDDADDQSSRPDFIIPVYPAYLGAKDDPWTLNPAITITKDTPPAFIAVTQDDKERGAQSALFMAAMKKAGVVCELHVYAVGGHGYGIRPSKDPVSTWHQRCGEWMKRAGLLKKGE